MHLNYAAVLSQNCHEQGCVLWRTWQDDTVCDLPPNVTYTHLCSITFCSLYHFHNVVSVYSNLTHLAYSHCFITPISITDGFITCLIRQGNCVFGCVCLSVCLSVTKIAQEWVIGLLSNSQDIIIGHRSVTQTDYILEKLQ